MASLILCFVLFIFGVKSQSSTSLPPLSCPLGFTDGGDKSCYSTLYSIGSRNQANSICSKSGGYLIDIHSRQLNEQIRQLFGVDIWLGLTCSSNDVRGSCLWDGIKISLNSTSYSNFYRGAPDQIQGPCVFQKNSDGMWHSASCTYDSANFICKYTPGIIVPNCSPSFDKNNHLYQTYLYRDTCYWPLPMTTYYNGRSVCPISCGTATSIHSLGENNFIADLPGKNATKGVYIGLTNMMYNAMYKWDDGSKFNYAHFEEEKTAQEYQCMKISTVGLWYGTGCSEILPLVCEKSWQNSCDLPSIPSNCSSPQYFSSNNGTIYSAGYPYGPDNPSCEYIITVDDGKQAKLSFSLLSLASSNSSLVLYSSLENIRITSTTGENIFISSTNIIRLVFNSAYNDGSIWAASYSSAPNQTCTSTFYLTNNGTVSSPGYPDGSAVVEHCEYVITVEEGAFAKLFLSKLYLNSTSSLVFYSDLKSETPFTTLRSKSSPTTIISPTNVIRMYYNSTGDGCYWFAYIPTTMTPTTTIYPYEVCGSPKSYSGNGTILSPDYPRGSGIKNTCTYFISIDFGLNAEINVTPVLRKNSFLMFYSDNRTTHEPFLTLQMNVTNSSVNVLSPTNFLEMVYYTPGDGSFWTANYTDKPSCSFEFYGPGTITSTGYPIGYATYFNRSCFYYLNAQSILNKTCVIFDDIDLHSGDGIYIYDGNLTEINPLASFNSSDQVEKAICSVLFPYLTVLFVANQYNGNSGRGFRGAFSDSPDKLAITTTSTPTNSSYCGLSYKYNGTVTSQNYPNPYPNVTQSCSYIMNSLAQKTCLTFSTIDLRTKDYITLYDGGNTLMARFNSSNSTPQMSYCSTNNKAVSLVFSTFTESAGEGKKGFKLKFDAGSSTSRSFSYFLLPPIFVFFYNL